MNRREFLQEAGTVATALVAAGGCLTVVGAVAADAGYACKQLSAGGADVQLSWQSAMPFALPVACPGTLAAVVDRRSRKMPPEFNS